jgi:uncharacterized protein YehS (DUF1456 family)
MAQITETIHHGDTVIRNSIEIGNEAVTRQHVSRILSESAYNSHRADDDAVISKILAGLMMSGKAQHGWARYTLENEI